MRRVDGARVRDLRLGRDQTQEGLAHDAGIGSGTVRGIEAGRIQRPRPLTMRAIARALGTTVDEITVQDEAVSA